MRLSLILVTPEVDGLTVRSVNSAIALSRKKGSWEGRGNNEGRPKKAHIERKSKVDKR